MNRLNENLANLRSANTFEELVEYFGGVIEKSGFYAFTLGVAPLVRGKVDSARAAFFSTLADAFREDYEKMEAPQFDPVFDLMATRYLPFTRSSIDPLFEESPERKGIVELAENYDMGEAFMIPAATSEFSRGLVLFTRIPQAEFEAMMERDRGFLHVVGLHFFSRAEELGFGPQADVAKSLSRRETECLERVAMGKTIDEIAAGLGITERTVRFHIGNACKKLGTDRRSKAVTLAIQQGLIRT